MNVTVFGATGAIGSLTVDELLAHGHTVTAYARNRAKVPERWGDHVRIVVGELSDAQSIDDAVNGADVIVSALGPSMDKKATGLPLVTGTEHILGAMNRHGVTRYIGHGTPSVADPREKRTAQTRLVGFMGRTFLPRAYNELLGMTDRITKAGIDWTIVRFTAPKDGNRTGKIRVGFYGTDRIGFAVTRADIASFTAAQVGDHTYVGRAPAISN
jgi:putative NADH-flavin reductase